MAVPHQPRARPGCLCVGGSIVHGCVQARGGRQCLGSAYRLPAPKTPKRPHGPACLISLRTLSLSAFDSVTFIRSATTANSFLPEPVLGAAVGCPVVGATTGTSRRRKPPRPSPCTPRSNRAAMGRSCARGAGRGGLARPLPHTVSQRHATWLALNLTWQQQPTPCGKACAVRKKGRRKHSSRAGNELHSAPRQDTCLICCFSPMSAVSE